MKKEEFLKLAKDNPNEYCVLRDDPIATPMFHAPYKGVCLGEHTIEISQYSFEDCEKLETIIFNNSLKEIGDYAFVKTKIKSLTIPNSVERIGREIFPECIEEFSIPIKCIEYLDGVLLPYFTDIVFKGDRIIAKKTERFDKFNLYIKSGHFNFNHFKLFKNISYIHVGENVVFDFNPSINQTIPFFVDRIFVEKLNPAYKIINDCLVSDIDGYPLIYKKKKTLTIDSSITNVDYFPSINFWKWNYIRFDVSHNSNLKDSSGVIKNKNNRVLFIPDENEVFLFNCQDFAKNALQNHIALQKLVVCVDDNDNFNINSFLEMVAYYRYKRYSFDYDGPIHNNKISIVVPNWFRKSAPQFVSNSDIEVVVDDKEEPFITME